MYRYDDFDQRIVDERVAQFRDQTRRYPRRRADRGRVPAAAPAERPLHPAARADAAGRDSLRPAVVARSCASSRTSRARYDRGYGHFTTRQNIQFNWPQLEEVPDILAELAEVEMHAIQTSGNCIRNITTDHFAGVARRRDRRSAAVVRAHPPVVDVPSRVRVPAAQVQDRGHRRDARPRRDRSCTTSACTRVRNDAGEVGFRVIVGGGLGRTPIDRPRRSASSCRAPELLTYLDAILRVYNRYGRRDNKYKARIKILVKELHAGRVPRQVEAEWEHLRGGPAHGAATRRSRASPRTSPRRRTSDFAARRASRTAPRVADSRPFARWVAAQRPRAQGAGLRDRHAVAEDAPACRRAT